MSPYQPNGAVMQVTSKFPGHTLLTSADSNTTISLEQKTDLIEPRMTKKRTISPEADPYRKRMCGPPKDLVLERASESSQHLADAFIIRCESPWETFIKVYECELAGRLEMAIPRVRPGRLVAVKTIQGKNVHEMLQRFKKIQHPNILCSKDCFVDGEVVFMLHDEVSVSLDHIVACEAYLHEIELAAILAQILDGLLYLTSQRLEHPYLNSSNILVTAQGEIKICRLEECLEAVETPQYCKPLEVITMELMQKYEKEDNKTGVDDIERWPCDSHATRFLSSIAVEVSLRKLREVSLITT